MSTTELLSRGERTCRRREATAAFGALGFDGVTPGATGRPSYHPSVLLKLYIYGYLNRVQSSRRLERETSRNVELMWLTGRLVPDHKTIADFRKNNGAGLIRRCSLLTNKLVYRFRTCRRRTLRWPKTASY